MPTRKKPPAVPSGAQAERDHMDALLDEALGETFPASDPVSITCEKGGPKEGGAVPSVASATAGKPSANTAAPGRMPVEQRIDYWRTRKRSST